MSNLRLSVIGSAMLVLTACGGGGGGGSDGGSSGGSTSAVIPANETVLRTIGPGDLITYNVTVSEETYDFDGTVLSEGTFDTTMDMSYFESNFVLSDGTPLTLERLALGDGTVADSYFEQLSDGTIIQYIDNNGYWYYDIDFSIFGIPLIFSPLEPNTASSFNYYRISDGGKPERVGLRTVSIGGLEVVNTPLGQIETYRVTIRETEEDYFEFFPALTHEVETETFWINPEIGFVRIRGVYESFLGTLRVSSTEIVAGITSVNFPIPAAE